MAALELSPRTAVEARVHVESGRRQSSGDRVDVVPIGEEVEIVAVGALDETLPGAGLESQENSTTRPQDAAQLGEHRREATVGRVDDRVPREHTVEGCVFEGQRPQVAHDELDVESARRAAVEHPGGDG